MKVTTTECKEAIVTYCCTDEFKTLCETEFVPAVDPSPAQKAKNWKREAKLNAAGVGSFMEGKASVLREFDCRPYDSQLRAYVWEQGGKIKLVQVCAE